MPSFLGLDFTRNLSYFAVPAAFWCAHSAHLYTIVFAGKSYDNSNPLALRDRIAKEPTLSAESKEHFIRAKNASQNGYETLGLFAAGVVAANQAGVSRRTLNALSWGYVVSRVVYNFIYINLGGYRKAEAFMRSSAWSVSMFLSVGLFIVAGFK
ncbi:hypothetical protein S40285_09699 [Stachybotrys chlorohalonatus IBT 40285]|uniref:Uncharacterized protein n=1 Tax=Stachybotrys chlorohalonatus (strain IBT 40285) TaxID=1283841 RepID=A0A084QSC0_STAC4|nr:hypothetical protein S40285_09699 [Stachybotrys chlorohalonata IBT 40285]